MALLEIMLSSHLIGTAIEDSSSTLKTQHNAMELSMGFNTVTTLILQLQYLMPSHLLYTERQAQGHTVMFLKHLLLNEAQPLELSLHV